MGAKVAEDVDRRSFSEVARDRFLGPMGMNGATYDPIAAIRVDHAVRHTLDGGVLTPHELDTMPSATCAEYQYNAGLYASVEDVGHMIEHFVGDGGRLAPASIAQFTTPQSDPSYGEGFAYGYGSFVLDFRGERFVLASTSQAGTVTATIFDPSRKFGVVLLGNYEGLPNDVLEKQAFLMASRFLDLPGPDPDFSAPSKWPSYVGEYTQVDFPFDHLVVTQTDLGGLRLRSDVFGWDLPLTNIGLVAYSAGGAFTYRPPTGPPQTITFQPDATGAIAFAVGDASIAERVRK